jgi:hypothetical protein
MKYMCKSSFVSDFVKGVQILHKINIMRYMYVCKYENDPFVT